MNNNHIRKWLMTTKIPLSKIAKESEVSRGALYNFINGKNDLRGSTKVKLLDSFENEIRLTNNKLTIKGGISLDKRIIKEVTSSTNDRNEIDASYILKLQKNEINRLESEVTDLKGKITEVDSAYKKSYNEIKDYEIVTKTQMKFAMNGVSRTVLSLTNMDVFANKLGYTKQELSCYVLLGENFKMYEHPIERLLHKDSTALVRSLLKSLPKVYDILRGMIGNHYLPLGLSYIHKNGHLVHTINYSNVDWSTKIVSTKTKFTLEEN